MKVNPYVFRQYDIRGVVEEDFCPEFVLGLGKAFGTLVKREGLKKIALSGDIRLSTPKLKKHFQEGTLSVGIDVIDLGILPTPVNYYSMWKLNVDAAVQITGSHNPANMNGFKMTVNKQALYGDQIQELRTLMEQDDFENGEGAVNQYNIMDDYIEMIQSKIVLDKEMKVAMDCGNASACLVAPTIFQRLGVELTELFCDVDGTFPNHHPDPNVPQNLAHLIDTIQNGTFDAGLAYDGDADRIGLIDEIGNIIFPDQIMSLMLPEIVNRDDQIIFDVKCSQSLEDEIIRLGGQPVIWKTGHSLIKQKMRRIGSPFGGEMSGHICLADDYFGYDDAIYVSARVVQMLSRQDKKLSELVAALPQYHSTPEIRLNCVSDEEKFRIDKEATAYFKNNYDCLDIDGVRIRFSDGWGLVRASNTQPALVCRFEAKTKERMQEIESLVLNKLSELGEFELSSHP
ncbi:MAG: phosphomannomutase/phosphoglucomutase [Candidatus Poribacteria bacterium]|jgi:phosphomannomutase/phosphoglucomutase|nr:phosphomannomutase/phosphoglucomutase [Candidatus Poribacteria bacterium]MDP6747970.1 phosphomannomutase/phosphoglucomutase [Candidatus Poribacteria bacterium]MDP6995560.1 phosphomannomutase/phosphoglucomutase [Candidatus Poribacteria bacterium]